jgi:CDP-diacylglycerol--serine O-phosphatidyltransferase
MAARLTGQYSEVGKQLDSLADVVSFGVAPSSMLFSMYGLALPAWNVVPPGLSNALGFALFAVALFSALRLAKFNIDDTQTEEFSGLPTPAAGLAIAGLPLLWPDMSWMSTIPREAFWVLAALVCFLLICPVRMFSLKFKTPGWRGNRLRYLFLASSAVLVALLGIGGVTASVGLYVLLGALRHVAGMRPGRSE